MALVPMRLLVDEAAKGNYALGAYNVNNIQDPLNFWDSSIKKYVPITNSLYQDLLDGKLRI